MIVVSGEVEIPSNIAKIVYDLIECTFSGY
jgi:hypothetical protein